MIVSNRENPQCIYANHIRNIVWKYFKIYAAISTDSNMRNSWVLRDPLDMFINLAHHSQTQASLFIFIVFYCIIKFFICLLKYYFLHYANLFSIFLKALS